jgi:beclin 1
VQQFDLLKEREKNLDVELRSLTEELKLLNSEEIKYWEDFSSLEKDIYTYEREKTFAKYKIANYERDTKIFQNKNILKELFNIYYSDKYGSINGFRMGAMDGSNVRNFNLAII